MTSPVPAPTPTPSQPSSRSHSPAPVTRHRLFRTHLFYCPTPGSVSLPLIPFVQPPTLVLRVLLFLINLTHFSSYHSPEIIRVLKFFSFADHTIFSFFGRMLQYHTHTYFFSISPSPSITFSAQNSSASAPSRFSFRTRRSLPFYPPHLPAVIPLCLASSSSHPMSISLPLGSTLS